jgi:arylsulfatase A-like enzyme
LIDSDFTVAEMLKQAGYATGGFGKWGLGDAGTTGAPEKQGFDEFFGYLNQVHAHYFYPEFLYQNGRRFPLEGNDNGRRTYSHDVIASKALDFIERYRSRPVFCYVPFTIPHLELLVPEDSIAEYRGKFEERPYKDPRDHYAAQPESRAAYAGMITRMDRDVGRITSLLTRLGIDDNTIVVFTSDNGAASPLWRDDYFNSTGGLRGHKQNLYEGGIRVPMVARWKGRIGAGKVSDHPWAFWDFMPTAAELAGVQAPDGIDGISVAPALLGHGKQRIHEFLYWEMPRYNNQKREFLREVPMQAVRTGDWKAVRPKPDGPLELYNLKTDPGESNDVSSTNPKMVARIESYLKTARTDPRPQQDTEQDFRKRAPLR